MHLKDTSQRLSENQPYSTMPLKASHSIAQKTSFLLVSDWFILFFSFLFFSFCLLDYSSKTCNFCLLSSEVGCTMETFSQRSIPSPRRSVPIVLPVLALAVSLTIPQLFCSRFLLTAYQIRRRKVKKENDPRYRPRANATY